MKGMRRVKHTKKQTVLNDVGSDSVGMREHKRPRTVINVGSDAVCLSSSRTDGDGRRILFRGIFSICLVC